MLDAATLKQARAALFLVPILGLNFLLLPIRPGEESGLATLYDVISAAFASFQVVCIYCLSPYFLTPILIVTNPQGVAVSFLLCFTNSEILSLLRTRFTRYLDTNNISLPGLGHIDTNFHFLTLGNSRSDNPPESV